MSEDRTAYKEAEVSYEDFVLFADAKKINRKCPSCNSDNWIVLTEVNGSNVPFILAKKPHAALDTAVSLDVVLNVCNVCGFLRTYVKRTIEIWLQSNRNGEA